MRLLFCSFFIWVMDFVTLLSKLRRLCYETSSGDGILEYSFLTYGRVWEDSFLTSSVYQWPCVTANTFGSHEFGMIVWCCSYIWWSSCIFYSPRELNFPFFLFAYYQPESCIIIFLITLDIAYIYYIICVFVYICMLMVFNFSIFGVVGAGERIRKWGSGRWKWICWCNSCSGNELGEHVSESFVYEMSWEENLNFLITEMLLDFATGASSGKWSSAINIK